MSFVKVLNVSKKYRQGESEIMALDGISLDLQAGKTLAITGASGSGKTTLLSLLGGLESVTQGLIKINDKEITLLNEKKMTDFRASHIGIIFQSFHLLPHLSALENVALPLEIIGDESAKAKATHSLKDVGLEKRLHHRPGELSGGERQRVAIARAFSTEPALLLADEPSGNLDTQTGETVTKLLFGLVKNKNMTMVLVTHDLSLANQCDQQIRLSGGKVQ